jgi:glycosyltransferase involved in cell wall biosynthesis
MKILFIHQYYFPEMSGTARRTKEMAESFVKKGHKVSVITSFPRSTRTMPGYKTKYYEVMNGVNIYRLKNIFSVGKNPFIRILSYFVSTLLSLQYISRRKKNYDIVISVSPLASGIAGAAANYLYKVYHHFDVPDILPDLGIAAGMLKNKYLIKILFIIEKWVYSNSNSISLTTKGHIKKLIDKGVPKKKLKWMPDWIDEEYYFSTPIIPLKNEKNYLFYKNNKIITFLGNIGALQGPDTFLELMKDINHEEKYKVKFLFIGNGIMVPSLKARIKNEDIKNIHFLGNIDRSHVRSYLNISDILISNYLDHPALDTYIPGKIFEYIISGKPIIMGGRGDVKELIEKYDAGFVIEPSNVGLFKNAIYNILSGKYYFKPDITKFLRFYSMKNVINRYNKMIFSFRI